MITFRENETSYIIDFSDNEDWDGFEKIMIKLKRELKAKVLEKNDGPESRVWHLEINGFPMSLHHNPYGNYLKASTREAKEYLKSQISHYKIIFY